MQVVYNIAHKNQAIRSLQGAKLRVLGFFPSQDQAFEFVKEWTAVEPDLETRVSPISNFRVLSKQSLSLNEQEVYVQNQLKQQISLREQKIQEVLTRAQKKEAPDESCTQTVVEIQKNEEGLRQFHQTNLLEEALPNNQDMQNIPKNKDSTASQKQDLDFAFQKVLPVKKTLTMANQNLAAIAILPDDFVSKSVEDQEPCFAFLSQADNEENLQKAIQNSVQSYYHGPTDSIPWSYFPIVGIQMQEFVSLSKQSEMSKNRHYHDKDLQALWDAHKTNGFPGIVPDGAESVAVH